MEQKTLCTYQQAHQLVKCLAENLTKPDFIVAIGGGGYVPARAMRNHFKVPVLAVTVESYTEDKRQTELRPRQLLCETSAEAIRGKKILVVDDIDDTRVTLEYVVNYLLECGCDPVMQVAVLHSKKVPKVGKLPLGVDFVAGIVIPNVWIEYEWELQ